jgi:hypothetical protein
MASVVKTVSASPIWMKVCEDFNISPSKAFKDGLVIQLALRYPEFPRNELEEALYNDSVLPAYKAQMVQKLAAVYGTQK